MAEKDPTKGRNAINKCIETMKEIKDPGERISPWDAILDAAALIKDEPPIWETLDRALTGAATWRCRGTGLPPRPTAAL